MRTTFSFINTARGRLAGGVAACALAFLGAHAALGAAFLSPVGTWDCIMTGPRDGVAFMTFQDDFTITMDEVLVPIDLTPVATRSNPGNDDSRTGDTNGVPAHTNLFGEIVFPEPDPFMTFHNFITQITTNHEVVTITNIQFDTTTSFHFGHPQGQWGYDTSGKLFGFFTEISAAYKFITNSVLQRTEYYGPFVNTIDLGTNGVTNIFVIITNAIYATNVEALRITNQISFTGKVVPGKRLTLGVNTPDGKSTFRGLPPLNVADVSGHWFARKKNQGLVFNEFFNATLIDQPLNTYSIEGDGPGYYYSGDMLVSRQNRFGLAVGIFALGEEPDPAHPVRAITGTINARRRTITGKGEEGNGANDLNIVFGGTHSP